MKEIAIDCPLLINGNKFDEEIKKYKKCFPPTLENVKNRKIICPALCEFEQCDYKCDSKKLNKKYYNKGDYSKLDRKEIDFNTFNDKLAGNEINDIKNKIKLLYKYKSIYLYSELLEKIKDSLKENQKDLFEDYYLDKALNILMPRTQNDFNNFNDIVFDKFN